MNIRLISSRVFLVVLVLVLVGDSACASNAELSPRKEAPHAASSRGCGAAPADTAVRLAPPPPVVGMCR